MTPFYIFVLHGSRHQAGVDKAQSFQQQLSSKYKNLNFKVAYIQFNSPSLESCIQSDELKGYKIIILPLFLMEASHVLRDIPEAIHKGLSRNPGLNIQCLDPIGKHPMTLKWIQSISVKKQASKVLILSRGSSDPKATQAFQKHILPLNHKPENIEYLTSFYDLAEPNFEQELFQLCQSSKDKALNILIVPYLLFPGKLLEDVVRICEKAKSQYKKVQIESSEILGESAWLWHILDELILHP